MRLPKGYSDKPGFTKIAVQLTHKTFKRIREIAERDKVQFSEALEDVVTCGLLCLDESDTHEPAKGATSGQDATC